MFNAGYLMALNHTGSAGGAITLTHIDGPAHWSGRGIAPSAASLPIYAAGAPSSVLVCPSAKFDASGIAIIEFLWDAGAVPHTTSSRTGIVCTRCRYELKLGTHLSSRGGDLLWFSNVGDFAHASPHFATPTVPVATINTAINKAATQARRLAAIYNSLSRPVLAGLVIA